MRGILTMAAIAAVIVAGAVACATAGPPGVGCARLSYWSPDDQKALAAAYRAAAEGSIQRRAIDDLQYMRDQARACRGEKPPA